MKGAGAIAFDVENIFAKPSKAQYHALLRAHRQRPAGAVLFDPAFYGGGFMAGHRRDARPALVNPCGVLPLHLASRDIAPFGMGLPPARLLNQPRNAALSILNRRVLAGASRVLNEFHRELHGTEMPTELANWARHADAIVQFTVETLSTHVPMRRHICTSSVRCRPPDRKRRCHRGGTNWTGRGPSSMSLRARWPTSTMNS